jgi:hypothetical protein
VPRSIHIFSYPYPLAVSQIQGILEKNKKITFTKKDKRHNAENIELVAQISKIKKTDHGITGHVNYEYQELIYQDTENEKSFILTEQYDFLVSPSQKCFIISGSSQYRDSVARLIDETLHPDEEETASKGKVKSKSKEQKSDFRRIIISKEMMYKLVMRIKEFDLHNDVERPNFEFINKKLDKLDDIDYSQSGTCITAHEYFKKHYPVATYWSPKMRITKCNGIVDELQTNKVGLTLGYSGEFSLTQSASPIGWYRFVFETCKKIGII